MLAPPSSVYWRLAIAIVIACLLVTALIASEPNRPGILMIGIIFGSAFQHPVLAACWCAVGPGLLRWRLLFGLVWAVALAAAFALGLTITSAGPSEAPMFFLMTLGVWFVAQLPMWLLRLLTGLRLRHQAPVASQGEERQWQFGIRQLMLLTAVVAVLLGAGRLLVTSGLVPSYVGQDARFMAFMVTAQVVANLPLSVGALLPRQWWLGILVGLVLVAGVTAIEIPLSRTMMPPTPLNATWLFISINGFSALWSLILAGVIRSSGYHFGLPPVSGWEAAIPDAQLAKIAVNQKTLL